MKKIIICLLMLLLVCVVGCKRKYQLEEPEVYTVEYSEEIECDKIDIQFEDGEIIMTESLKNLIIKPINPFAYQKFTASTSDKTISSGPPQGNMPTGAVEVIKRNGPDNMIVPPRRDVDIRDLVRDTSKLRHFDSITVNYNEEETKFEKVNDYDEITCVVDIDNNKLTVIEIVDLTITVDKDYKYYSMTWDYKFTEYNGSIIEKDCYFKVTSLR